jgi:hypothetical protein
MHGKPGKPYDEVIGAQVLLGYSTTQQQQQAGGLRLISHPAAGTQVRNVKCEVCSVQTTVCIVATAADARTRGGWHVSVEILVQAGQ